MITKGNSGFQQRAFNDMQKLTSRQLLLLNNGNVAFADTYKGSSRAVQLSGLPQNKGAGEKLFPSDKPYGTELINDVISSKNTITIEQVQGENDEFKPLSIKDGMTDGKGSGGTLFYNPDGKGKGMKNKDGSYGGPPGFITLGHEFIHGRKSVQGRLLNNSDEYKVDPDSPSNWIRFISTEEVDTRVDENKLRKENLIKLRDLPYGF